jgi:2-keto-myo-inositol isomerase
MKLGFHGATTMTSTLETDVEVSAAAGFKGLEVWAAKADTYLATHTVDELRDLFISNAVEPLAINSIEFIGFRGNDYPFVQKRCSELSKIAQSIGCPTIAVVPSPTTDRNILWPQVVEEYVAVLRDLGSIAAQYNIRLAFEFLGFGWCSVRTPRGASEIVQKTDRENVGMIIDAAHFYAGGARLIELEHLDGKRIFAFHIDDLEDTPREAISDATRLFPGYGIVPLEKICAILRAIGYDGHCSVELFRPEYWQRDPLAVAREAKASALKLLSPYFTVEQ